ncbi:MAG: nicotinamide-nucleotide amidohydrolase family protein [Rhizobiaceae bacterium]
MKIDRDLSEMAALTLEHFRAAGLKVATAESCTGGLISALLTSHAGSSDVLDRGFVTYSNAAKSELVGVPPELIVAHGAVSAAVAAAMATGALARSAADAAVAVTGIAGPGGGSEQKPVGLVYIAVATKTPDAGSDAGPAGAYVEEFTFEDKGRDHIRNETVRNALEMLIAYGADTPG